MAEDKKTKTDPKTAQKLQDKKVEKEQKKPEKHFDKEILEEALVRIAGYDVPGSRNLYTGLTRIKGVSWSISNATCIKLGFSKSKKISELTKDEIAKIEYFIKNPDIADFLKNRRFDEETGETKHFVGSDLDIKRDFDIRRMKKIRSYKGVRHSSNQPVRGQRTRSHFRKQGKTAGVKRAAKKEVKK